MHSRFRDELLNEYCSDCVVSNTDNSPIHHGYITDVLLAVSGDIFVNAPYPECTVPGFGPHKTLFVWASESTQLTVD